MLPTITTWPTLTTKVAVVTKEPKVTKEEEAAATIQEEDEVLEDPREAIVPTGTDKQKNPESLNWPITPTQ